MKNMPNIFKFLLIFFFAYIVLSALSYVKPLRSAAVPVYNTFQQLAFNIFHPTIRTGFKTYEGDTDQFDYSIYIYSDEEWQASRNRKMIQPYVISNQNARITAFGPFIMLLSLILASPISWKRKLLSFALGGFFVLILLAMKYTALFDANMTDLKPVGGSIWVSLSNLFNEAFRTHEFLALIIIPIWALSSFRTRDWKWFIQ